VPTSNVRLAPGSPDTDMGIASAAHRRGPHQAFRVRGRQRHHKFFLHGHFMEGDVPAI
jgi:hypothetical protein